MASVRKRIVDFFSAGALSGRARRGSAPQAVPEGDETGSEPAPAPRDEALPDVKDVLTWSQAERVVGFRNDYRAYPGDVFRHGEAAPLPAARRPLLDVSYSSGGQTYGIAEHLERQSATALLVLKNGEVAYEYYGKGNNSATLWTSRSVGKSVVSTLVGAALRDGAIGSLDDLITDYEPDFAGSGWDGVTLRQLITHTSGIEWNEDYTDPASHFSQMTRHEAGAGTYEGVRSLVRGLGRRPGVAPGQSWSYATGGAWLLGDVLERATGKSIAAYLEEKVWRPFGMADDGVWHSYVSGTHDCGGHGFNATLRDWGRFGLFVLRDGALPDGTKALPDGWAREARTWTQAEGSATEERPEGTYGYQWWNNAVPASAADAHPRTAPGSDESMWALGIFGQIIAINPKEDLVMVQWSTWKEATPPPDTLPREASLLFNAFARALHGQ